MSIYGNPLVSGLGTKLNIDYGNTAPSDTSKLWIPLGNKPKKILADTVLKYGDNLHETIVADNNVSSTKLGSMTVSHIKNGKGTGGFFADGKYIYCSGAESTAIIRYNMETNGLEYVASVNEDYFGNCLAVVDGYVYINAGQQDGVLGGNGKKVNISTGAYEAVAALRRPNVSRTSSVVWNNKIYQFGGGYSTNTSDKSYNKIYCFNLAVNSEERISTTLPAYYQVISPVVVGNYAYLFGGRRTTTDDSYGTETNKILKYNFLNNTITEISVTLPTACSAISAQLFMGKIYMLLYGATSTETTGYAHNNLCIFDTSTETIQQVGVISQEDFSGSGACGLYNGSIYFISGQNYASVFNGNVLKLTPKTALDKDILFIQESFLPKNKVAIINSNETKVMCNVEGAWLGNNDNYADKKNAYIYNTNTSHWELAEGVSITADALNALNILGVE